METLVTVATINIHGREERWRQRRHLLVAQLIESGADLIGVQQVYLATGQAVWLCRQINVRLSGSDKEPYRVIQKSYRHLVHGLTSGVAVLSRLPVLYNEELNLGYGGRIALRIHVELPSHQTMDFVTTQLHHVPYEREARQEQAMKLTAWLHGHKRVPIQVVAGDMNEVPDGPAITLFKQSFRSAYEDVYRREPLATFPTALGTVSERQGNCLDYIFVSSAVRRVARATIFCDAPASDDNTLYASDHVGLLATLEV
jgi:endonuclease/exonuclease/phosphatase family metal-dependent hydrolase